MLQEITHFKPWVKPLKGAFITANDTVLSRETWFSGEYQEKKEKYLKQNFGLQPYYIRLISQANYTLFDKVSTNYVVVGKEGYLYETGYIDAYYGRDFIGKTQVNDQLAKLRDVQDTLSGRKKLMLLVFAPGKASFYPEYIPEWLKSPAGTSNYLYFSAAAKKQALNHIDFNKYFIAQKHRSKYPMYPQYGIHWSNHASILAFDSIIHYIERKLGADLPDIKINSIALSDSLREPDKDIIESANLFFYPRTFKMAYPDCSVDYDPARHKKLNLLVIADSFWWQIYSSYLPGSVFASSRFWYYNKEMYPESYTAKTYVGQGDYLEKLKAADVIMIMHTEATLARFGGGFVDMAYEVFCHTGYQAERIAQVKEAILNTPEWHEQIRKKARERNISVDSMMVIDALYMIEEEKKRRD